jgi:ribosomal protein L7/L12
MESHAVIEVDHQIVATGSELWAKSHDIEALLHSLRERGVSRFDSIKLVRQICQVTLGEAKKMVVFSAEWSDTVESTAQFHDAVAEAVKAERS